MSRCRLLPWRRGGVRAWGRRADSTGGASAGAGVSGRLSSTSRRRSGLVMAVTVVRLYALGVRESLRRTARARAATGTARRAGRAGRTAAARDARRRALAQLAADPGRGRLRQLPSPARSHSDSTSRIDRPRTNAPITIARSGSVRSSFVPRRVQTAEGELSVEIRSSTIGPWATHRHRRTAQRGSARERRRRAGSEEG